MEAEEITYKKELLRTHERRLRELELKEALLGINCPPEIKIEIADLRQVINDLKNDVKRLTHQRTSSAESRQKVVLVVEDHKLVRTLVAKTLTEAGFRVITASDGIEGIQLATAEYPDLVLLDIILPGMNGYAVLSEIVARRIPTRILIFTGQSVSANILMKSGACDVLSKSIDLGDLIRAVNLSLELDSTVDVILDDPLRIINPLLIRLDDSYRNQLELRMELQSIKGILLDTLKALRKFQFDEDIIHVSNDIKNRVDRIKNIKWSDELYS